jgi:hypothetical protein
MWPATCIWCWAAGLSGDSWVAAAVLLLLYVACNLLKVYGCRPNRWQLHGGWVVAAAGAPPVAIWHATCIRIWCNAAGRDKA